MEQIKRAVLHNPILLGGVNLQMNLDTEKRTGLRLINDEAKQMLYIFCNGEYAKLPHPAVSHMIPVNNAELDKIFEQNNPPKPAKVTAAAILSEAIAPNLRKRTAQASTPMDHVFKGNGAGKTND